MAFNFKNIDRKGVYGYWDHMDYIIQKAEQNGIYIAMVCIWGGLVRSGKMNVEEAKAYGRFLGERYKDAPNIIQMGSTGCTTKRMKGHYMILVHSKNTIRQRLPNLSIPVSISISTDYPNNIRSIFISFT